MNQPSLAIIGTGISGLSCAHFLQHRYDISLYEKNDYIGGHAYTEIVQDEQETVYTDTAFVIFNDVNYPLFWRLLAELDVAKIRCPMSYSFKINPLGWEYNTKGLSYIPTNPKNLLDRRFLKLLWETRRFYKEATEIYREPQYADYSLADYVKEKAYSDDFLDYYLIPIIAVVWSIPPQQMLDFPAVTMVRFLENHGAFQGLFGRIRWSTVAQGSLSYKKKLTAPFKDKILTERAVTQVLRQNGKVRVTDQSGASREFDHVILACHADQALALLGDAASAEEKRLLSPFHYSQSRVLLHTDSSILPAQRSMWASWNYHVSHDPSGQPVASFTYYMNKLQKVSKLKDYFVTVNDFGHVDPAKVIKSFDYEHPIFDGPAIRAQQELDQLNRDGPIYFCGSYFKYGFHEDALRSGLELCRSLTGEKIWQD